MKKLILIALIMSILTGFAVYYYANNLERNLKVKTVPVAVAVKAIPKNTVITAEMVSIKQFPPEVVNQLAAKSLDDVKGKIAKQNIEAGEQIFTNRLNNPSSKSEGLSYSIKEGYRAFTIQTSELSGIAGRLSKGDHVDIITIIPDTNSPTGTAPKMVKENVEILELGTNQPATTEEKNAVVSYSSITLSVKAEDVIKLNYLLSEGKYNLALRSVLDEKVIYPES